MSNKAIVAILSIGIGIIIVGSVLVPIIQTSQTATVDYTNDPATKRLEYVTSFYADTGTLNDSDLSEFSTSINPLVIITSDFIAVSYSTDSSWGRWTALGYNSDTSSNFKLDSPIITVEDLNYTITNVGNTVTHTGTLEWALIPDNDGSMYVINSTTNTARVAIDADDIITASWGGSSYGVTIGSLTDQTTLFKITNNEVVSDYVTTIQYTVNEGGYSANVSSKTSDNVQYVIVPVVAEYKDNIPGVSILNAIPVIVIVSLLFAAVAIALRSRF